MFARGGTPGAGPARRGGRRDRAPARPPPIQIGPADYQAFEQLLQAVQAAWSPPRPERAARPSRRRRWLSYFAEQLAEQTSRGVRNVVTDVRLEQGDCRRRGARAAGNTRPSAMRFSMIDVTATPPAGWWTAARTSACSATEVWTFLRAPGGRWMLSAIQQAR